MLENHNSKKLTKIELFMENISKKFNIPIIELQKLYDEDNKIIEEHKQDKINLVVKLSDNFTKIIDRETLKNYEELNWGNNGIGDRWCNKKFNYSVIYSKKNTKTYSNNENDFIPNEVLDNFFKTCKKGNGIKGIFVHSIKQNIIIRPIRSDISQIIKQKSCVSCGSSSNIICDHKNDLYNDNRVLSIKTQELNDFQSLCEHCNLQKRQICKKEKENKKIYSAKNLEKFKFFPFEFPWEKKNFDESNIQTKIDTYWYDPIEFQSKVYHYFLYKTLIVDKIKKNP